MNEYLSPFFFKHFKLESFYEDFDSGSEKVDGDTYPSFFILKARRRVAHKPSPSSPTGAQQQL